MPETAQQQNDRLERDRLYLSARQVAARLGVSVSLVRAIPFDELPYLNAGTGLVRQLRRYHPDDVAACETARRERVRSAHGRRAS